MTGSSLREALGPQVQIRPVARNLSGSKENVVLRFNGDWNDFKSISAIMLLAKYGLNLKKAKRAVEDAMDHGPVPLILPLVDDKTAMVAEMSGFGFTLQITTPPKSIDIKAIRENLNLTQEQFSVLYGIELRTLQGYESGARKPDRTTLNYLRMIKCEPETMKRVALAAAG